MATGLPEPAVDYNLRTSLDLNRVVEDQWRKQLREQMEAEERGEIETLEEERREGEEEQRQKEKRKENKLKARRKDLENGFPKTEDERRKLEKKRIRNMMPVDGFIHAGR